MNDQLAIALNTLGSPGRSRGFSYGDWAHCENLAVAKDCRAVDITILSGRTIERGALIGTSHASTLEFGDNRKLLDPSRVCQSLALHSPPAHAQLIESTIAWGPIASKHVDLSVRHLGARIKQLRVQPLLASLTIFLVLGLIPMALVALYSAMQSIFCLCHRSLQLTRNRRLMLFTDTRQSRSTLVGHLEYWRAKFA